MGSRPDLAARNRERANPLIAAHQAEYHVWRAIRDRCHLSTSKDFSRYGGRGIYVCERWRESFDAFIADMGPRPSARYSIDRVNNDGPYSAENCRWATPIEQCRNRRSNRLITFKGEALPLVEWSARTGIGRVLIVHRLNAGWSVEEALTVKPSRSVNNKHARKRRAAQ